MPDSNRNPQVKGCVRVVREEGYCFVEPLEALPAGYILPRGRDIFLHCSANGGTLPSIGATGTFTIENSSRGGIQAIAVTWDEVRSFIHPYNFVSLPASGLGKAAEVQPFQRRRYISHERYDPQRYARFLRDTVPSLTVEKDVIAATRLSLQGYAERHTEKIGQDRATPRRLRAQPIPPYPSDFVHEHPAEVALQAGDLCYALVEDAGSQSIVWGLYPVAMPRLSHDHARDALLHHDFHPCHNPATLCPACRVFGWVRDEPGLRPDPTRVDAVAGHVRFTHAVLRGAWGTDTQRPEQVTLAILGSPKPTTTEFYLRPRADRQQAQKQRWPAAVQTEQRPIYRQEEAVLRGRKYYRRRQVVQPQSEEPAQNGLRRPYDKQDTQNQTVHLLPPDMEFGFRVYFDNLDHTELGALLFSLSLQPPEAWNRHGVQLRHALGHGKPLGMGACNIRIDALQLEDLTLTSPRHRYAQVPTYVALPPLHAAPLSSETTQWQELVRQFGHAWQRAETLERALQSTREDLLELLRLDPPDGPMHYPPNPNGEHEENYRWFMRNRRRRTEGRQGLHAQLPSPCDERDLQHRLPIDPTSP